MTTGVSPKTIEFMMATNPDDKVSLVNEYWVVKHCCFTGLEAILHFLNCKKLFVLIMFTFVRNFCENEKI